VGLVLRENPFYAESGGQVSDTGEVVGQGWRLPVDEVRKLEGGRTAVYGPLAGPFEPTSVEAVVNQRERRDTERNHTATHFLHAALRGVLGAHVRQAGSVVAPDRLRFDFTHHQPIDAATLAAIEAEINARVWENLDVTDEEMPYRAALELGAMALFGEKYGEVVRVVTVPGVSRELCGGTHVRTTGQIGLVRLVGESGVGAGVRRLEALSGPGAFRWLDQRQRLLEEAAQRLGSMPEHLSRRVEALVEERKKLEKRVQELIHRGGQPEGEVLEVNGRKVRLTYSSDRDEIRAMVDTLRSQGSSGILVNKSSAGWDVALTDDLVAQGLKAPDLVNRLAALSGGRGGGRAYFASAGAGDEARFREVSRQEIAAVLLPGSA
jgi:alanyl-tRNA synthetase